VTAYVAAFADFLALNRNASSHTVEAYRADVEQYLDCVARLRGRTVAQLAPPDLDLTSVRAYLGELHKRGQADSHSADPRASRPVLEYMPLEATRRRSRHIAFAPKHVGGSR